MYNKVYLDVLFLSHIYSDFKFCPSLLKIAGIHFPTQKFRDFPLFAVSISHMLCLSERCPSATNAIRKDTDNKEPKWIITFQLHLVECKHSFLLKTHAFLKY